MTILSPVVRLDDPLFLSCSLEVFIKRDDLIHPEVMGNKWRKLKYNLEEAINGKYEGVVTLGGAFSNHIAATATACRLNGIKSIGIIRGDELTIDSNHTLRKAHLDGMDLRFLSRSKYSDLRENSGEIEQEFPGYLIVPEGGTNEFAIRGVREIWDELDEHYDYVVCPFGTGGTMAGLSAGAPASTKVLGFSSLKGDFPETELKALLEKFAISNTRVRIFTEYHFGGYGKVSNRLLKFMGEFEEQHEIAIEPVYTGKMFYGFYDLVRADFFPPKSRILLIHTGGLQGKDGHNQIQSKKIR